MSIPIVNKTTTKKARLVKSLRAGQLTSTLGTTISCFFPVTIIKTWPMWNFSTTTPFFWVNENSYPPKNKNIRKKKLLNYSNLFDLRLFLYKNTFNFLLISCSICFPLIIFNSNTIFHWFFHEKLCFVWHQVAKKRQRYVKPIRILTEVNYSSSS